MRMNGPTSPAPDAWRRRCAAWSRASLRCRPCCRKTWRKPREGCEMGIYVIKMPDIGEGIAEVELVEWHVKEGDEVAEDQVLADVMTDKATVQVPSPVHGRVLALGGRIGEVMPVGSPLIRLEVEGPGNVTEEGAAPAVTTVASEPRAAEELVAASTA